MINQLAKEIHENARNKGFWDNRDNIVYKMGTLGTVFSEEEIKYIRGAIKGQMLMLQVSELGEALEADRKDYYGNRQTFETLMKTPEDGFSDDEWFKACFEKYIKNSFADELADEIIRNLDLCYSEGIDMEWHIKQKMRYNSLRPHKHGKNY